MSKKLLFRLFALVAAMMCALGMQAAVEAYANYTPSNTTLTFYYDAERGTRPGTTYDLNTGIDDTGWETDRNNHKVTQVIFDPSFAGARPTTTYGWFYEMGSLQFIMGMEYLNTSEVTNMAYMFCDCGNLTSLDLSHFNTAKVTRMNDMFNNCWGLTSLDLSIFNTSMVTDMNSMFLRCYNLQTIFVDSDWSIDGVTESEEMFFDCSSLVGGKGSTYDANHVDKEYAHIDGGTSNPGYFTEIPAFTRGDVDGNGSVNISDVIALIDYLLSGDASAINTDAADCNQDNGVSIADVNVLIDYLLSGTWN